MSGKVLISRRAFTGGTFLLGLGGQPARWRKALPGSARMATGFAPVIPGKTFAFPEDHGPHPDYRIEWWYVTANLADSAGRGLRRAVDLVSPGDAARRASGRLGQPAALDGTRRGDPRRHPPLQREIFPRRRRAGRCRCEAVSGLDRFLADARARVMHADTVSPLELTASGADFSLRAALRGRSAAGPAGRRRLQPEIGARTGLVLLQPALFQGVGPHHHRRQARRCHRPCLDGPGMEQPAAGRRIKPAGTGCRCISIRAKSSCCIGCARRDGKNYASGNWILPDGKTRQIASADIGMTPKALTEIEGRKIPLSWDIAIPALALNDRMCPAECEELDGNELSLLGRADQFCGQPQRGRLSGDDRVLSNDVIPGCTVGAGPE